MYLLLNMIKSKSLHSIGCKLFIYDSNNIPVIWLADRCDEGWTGFDCSYPSVDLPDYVYDMFENETNNWVSVVGAKRVKPCKTLASGLALHFAGVGITAAQSVCVCICIMTRKYIHVISMNMQCLIKVQCQPLLPTQKNLSKLRTFPYCFRLLYGCVYAEG